MFLEWCNMTVDRPAVDRNGGKHDFQAAGLQIIRNQPGGKIG